MVVSLTEHFYDLLSGSVMFDGTDLRELNIKQLHSQIGLVSQVAVLFATTIREMLHTISSAHNTRIWSL
ncbi:hypothetical protein BDR06DRAFT_892264 [Suillus hirtellus]|nr:hypothetical protein BDR06DRAFT_894350 [Suillus hirtellus]KAG2050205.1 hypothetical protein BDR06DRAFT_892264 [Suillus hirtellus]